MKQETPHPLDRINRKRIEVFLFASGFTVMMVGLLGGITYYLDHLWGTWPKLFIAGIVIAYPLTQFLLYKKYRPKRTPPKS